MFQNFDSTGDGTQAAGRLAALRARLDAKGYTGFLVPRADAHQGETIAPRDARLPWLTGFTGTAGAAVVLPDRAALFVDGRYTLQAANQVDAALFEVVATHKTPIGDWLAGVGADGDVIAYDPWLHGEDEIRRLAALLEEKGVRLTPANDNPIDAIWEDRPPPPGGAVQIHSLDLAGQSAVDKREMLGAQLTGQKVDAAFLSLPDSIAWLLNIRGSDLSHLPVAQGFALLRKDGTVDLFMDPDKLGGEVRAHLGNAVTVLPPSRIERHLGEMADQTVRLDRRSCPVWVAHRLEAAGARVDWGVDPCVAPKARKNAAELAGMRAAHLRDGAAMVKFLSWFDRQPTDAGLTEIDLVKKLEAIRVEAGIVDISFDTISGSGPNGAIVHYRVNRESNRVLKPGETVLVDSGGQYPDGTTDITRTFPFGPVDAAVQRPYTLVLKGMIALSVARWPCGLAGRDLDPLARQALWNAGYDYDHGTGHGVGAYLNVHEGPASISRRGEVALEPGMILSNEPGYYRTGAFGIRIENLVIVTPATVPEGGDRRMLGFETLTLCPIDRRLIRTDMLGESERAWLDAYHARVSAELGPHLEAGDLAWLEASCAPL